MHKEEFEKPSLTVDIIPIGFVDNEVSVLLIKRNRNPHNGRWGLIGGFLGVCPRNETGEYIKVKGKPISADETVSDTATRILNRDIPHIKFDIADVKPFKIYSDPRRDKRTRVVSACNFVVIPYGLIPGTSDGTKSHLGDSAETQHQYKWVPLRHFALSVEPKEMAFDHYKMVIEFIKELNTKMRSTPIVFDMMPNEFTIPMIKTAFESLFNVNFDNMSRYITSRYNLKEVPREPKKKKGESLLRKYSYNGSVANF